MKILDINLYSYYCDKLDALKKKYNPCGIIDNKCNRKTFCCDGCKHLTDTGCSIRSLYCKIWFCDKIDLNEEIKDVLDEIYAEIDREGKDYFYLFRDMPSFMYLTGK